MPFTTFATARYGTPAKNQLTVVTGRATNLSMFQSRVRFGGRIDHLHFTLGGINTEYASNRPGYPQLLAAIQSNQTLSLALSSKGEMPLHQYGQNPIYIAYVGSQPVVTYEQTATRNGQENLATFLTGGVVLCVAIWKYSKASAASSRRSPASYRRDFVGPRV
jgi:hypothetical protein